MQLECNGKKKCLNEIDLRSVLSVAQNSNAGTVNPGIDMPMRVILKCRHCTEGRVVITGDMFWNQHFETLAG